ncbi:rod shape-determining protein MreC [Alphaproteobacteria bacterium]|nr:rod shape-determining protein MreC [Alphaproteobacteria bacterium]
MFFEKSKLYKNKFFNSLLIITCLILIFVGKLDLIALRNLSSFLTDFLSPISSLVSKPALELENVIKDVQSATFLRDENIKLKSENRRLKIIETKLANTESEIIELKKLLNFKINSNKIIFTGRVLNISGGTFAKTMVVNGGSLDGIKKGQPVISSLGLVGSVISVGPSSSRVLLTIDINSMVPSYLTQSGWPAIAQGENGKLLKLRFLSSEAKPIIGEIIETSGHGGIFPSGVNVGKIISISNGNYYVEPLPNPQKLRFVSILSKVSLKERRKSIGFAPLQEDQNKLNLKGFNKFNN